MPRETEKYQLMHLMISGKQSGGRGPSGKDQDGHG